MSRVIPFTVLVIGVTVLLLTSSLQQTLLTLGSIGIALLWTFGLMGWLDWPQDGIHEVVAPLLLVVGVCDAMHYLSRFAARERHLLRAEGLVVAAREVGPACVVTTLTTGAAFLSFTASDLSTFDRFGVVTAFGTLACLLLTFTALPLAATLLPDRAPQSSAGALRFDAMIRRLMDAICEWRRSILALCAVLLAFFGIGWAAHLEAGSNWDEFFGADSTVRRWHRFVNTRFHPSQSLEIQLTIPPGEEVHAPLTLDRLSELQERLTPIAGLEDARSILDRIGLANRLVHGDDPAFEHAGRSAAANAELLEILTLGSPDDVARWLSMDRKHIRISAAAPAISHDDDTRVATAARRAIEQALPPGWDYSLSGQLMINADWVRDVLSTQLRSFPAALLVVGLILMLYFRSAFLTLAALLPTLIPVVVTLGSMGWLGITLDVGRAMIAAILIGIGVDDAVHVLTHYRRTIRHGEPPDRAIRAAVQHSGRAIVTTSAALSLGFLTLMASAWETISSFGLFICLAILGALVSTLLVLPAVVFAFERVPRGIRELTSVKHVIPMSTNGRRTESD